MNVRALAGAFLCLVFSAAVVAGSASAPPPAPGAPVDTSTAQSALSMIANLTKDLQAQTEAVQSMRSELQALLSQRPKNPGTDASDDAMKAYQQLLDEWSKQVDAISARLEGANAKLNDMRKRLDTTLSSDLPAAMKKDVEMARQAAAEARVAAEKTLTEAKFQRGGGVKPPSRTTTSPAPKPVPAPAPP